jgi:hypothetical protein
LFDGCTGQDEKIQAADALKPGFTPAFPTQCLFANLDSFAIVGDDRPIDSSRAIMTFQMSDDHQTVLHADFNGSIFTGKPTHVRCH